MHRSCGFTGFKKQYFLALFIMFMVGGCSDAETASDASTLPNESNELPAQLSCGDGMLHGIEECDDGATNSNVVPDACRLDCRLARCGDAILDTGEACDDGATWGGDGCSPTCGVEDTPPENEPNNTLVSARPLGVNLEVTGSIDHEEDVDCFSLRMEENNWLRARTHSQNEHCTELTTLRLYDPAGAYVASGYPDSDSQCANLNPIESEGARFLVDGVYTICVEGLFHSLVSTYTLSVEVGEDSCTHEEFEISENEDLDGDGIPDACDDDDDGDGILDEVDTCTRIPNFGQALELTTNSDGNISHWLIAGPYTGTTNETGCLPSDDFLAADDGEVVAQLANMAGDEAWTAHMDTASRLNFLDHYGGNIPREAYAATWVYSESVQSVTFSLGADDGARIWLNGTSLGEVATCQGATQDDFAFAGSLVSGWNRILIKVRDHGGQWGLYLRLLNGNAPLLDLPVSLHESGSFIASQEDSDGDGLGDICDPSPLGE